MIQLIDTKSDASWIKALIEKHNLENVKLTSEQKLIKAIVRNIMNFSQNDTKINSRLKDMILKDYYASFYSFKLNFYSNPFNDENTINELLFIMPEIIFSCSLTDNIHINSKLRTDFRRQFHLFLPYLCDFKCYFFNDVANSINHCTLEFINFYSDREPQIQSVSKHYIHCSETIPGSIIFENFKIDNE